MERHLELFPNSVIDFELTCIVMTGIDYVLGEPLGKYHKFETITTLNIYISAYQAIITSYMKMRNTEFFGVCFMMGQRGGQNMCQALNNGRGYWDHTQT